MSKISIDVGLELRAHRVLSKQVSAEIFMAIREWFDGLGDNLDLVEVVTVKVENHGGKRYVIIKMVVVDPMAVHEGVIISDPKRPRLEDSINWGACDHDDKITPFFPSLKVRLDEVFRRILSSRLNALKHNAEEIEELLAKLPTKT